MKQKVQKMLMLAGALLLTTVVLAQVPSNDETCGALLLSPNESGLSCPPEGNDYTTAGATASPGNPCGLAAWGDVWFKFIATADSHRVHISKVHALAGGIVNPGIAVYNSTDCTALGTAMACRTTGPKIMTFNTTPGDMYYIRVWTAGYELPAGPDHFTFKLCLGAPTALLTMMTVQWP